MIRLLFAGCFMALACSAASAAQTGLSEDCKKVYKQYFSAKAPKAFARGQNNTCGWKGPGGNVTLNQAKQRAIDFCKAYGGAGCRVVESKNK